jgi:hypothetical protein
MCAGHGVTAGRQKDKVYPYYGSICATTKLKELTREYTNILFSLFLVIVPGQ